MLSQLEIVWKAFWAPGVSLDSSTYWTADELAFWLRSARYQVRTPAGSANRWVWQVNERSGTWPPFLVATTDHLPSAPSGFAELLSTMNVAVDSGSGAVDWSSRPGSGWLAVGLAASPPPPSPSSPPAIAT